MTSIKFKKIDSDAIIPHKATPDSIGLDLCTTGKHFFDNNPDNNTVYWNTGLSVEPPNGYYFQIHARSSLHKKGWMLANSVGIIDPDYRGELIIALKPSNIETDDDGYIVNNWTPIEAGTRIAQLILCKNYMSEFSIDEVDELSKTIRGDGGFGSTGNK